MQRNISQTLFYYLMAEKNGDEFKRDRSTLTMSTPTGVSHKRKFELWMLRWLPIDFKSTLIGIKPLLKILGPKT